MSTTKLGGYSFIIASIFLFVGGFIPSDFERIGSILAVYGFMGLAFAIYALCSYFRKDDKDNGLLTLIPILALIGWTANAYGSAINIAESMASIETVNAVASIGGLIGFTGGVGGFISAALIGIYVLGNPKFIPNSIYKVLTILFIIAGFAMSTMATIMPLLSKGRDAAKIDINEVVTAGSQNFAFDASMLFFVWIYSMIMFTLWSIYTGLIMLGKEK